VTNKPGVNKHTKASNKALSVETLQTNPIGRNLHRPAKWLCLTGSGDGAVNQQIDNNKCNN
jgi:hypothetical protein